MLQLPLTLLILFVTHALGGIAAFGSALLSLPILLLADWPLRPAVGLLMIVGLVQAGQMIWLTRGQTDRRALLAILGFAGLGLPVGFFGADLMPERGLQVCLGTLLVLAGATRLAEHCSHSEWTLPDWALRVLLLAGGVIHGAFGTGGTTITVYARFALRTKEAFRGTLPYAWLALNTAVLAGLATNGDIPVDTLAVALAGAPTVLVATLAGQRLAASLSQERFADLVAVLLCLAGMTTILRNLTVSAP